VDRTGHRDGSYHGCGEQATTGIVIPCNPKEAIRDPDPVLYFEHKKMYRSVRGEVPDGEYTVPIGKAAVRREGSDLTIVAVSRQAVLATVAAEKLEEEDVDAEVIDLRSIRPLDWKTITDSVRKTNRLLVVEEGWPTYGVGAEIAAGVQERCFDDLDAPILRLGGAEVPMPYNQHLEKAAIPSADDIVRRALKTIGRNGAGSRN